MAMSPGEVGFGGGGDHISGVAGRQGVVARRRCERSAASWERSAASWDHRTGRGVAG
jgi:hypothetical protein